MARQLQVVQEPQRPCSYVGAREASLIHRVIVDVSLDEHDALLTRGWRRFGYDYFRPACECSDCLSLRIPTASFEPSKTQRRIARTLSRIRVEVGVPKVDQTRLSLFRQWHKDREDKREWEHSPMSPRNYAQSFAFPHVAAREHVFYVDDRKAPVGVGLVDETATTHSAVYFYYDPEFSHLSLGTINVLHGISRARELSIPYFYLGFLVQDCPSLTYKQGFRPSETLIGRPEDDEAPVWLPFAEARR